MDVFGSNSLVKKAHSPGRMHVNFDSDSDFEIMM